MSRISAFNGEKDMLNRYYYYYYCNLSHKQTDRQTDREAHEQTRFLSL